MLYDGIYHGVLEEKKSRIVKKESRDKLKHLSITGFRAASVLIFDYSFPVIMVAKPLRSVNGGFVISHCLLTIA